MVWHHTVAPGDVVVVDRNCHKSILHAIIMTGAIPVFLTPTRNHFGIIGPIPQSEFEPENIQTQDRGQPAARGRRRRTSQAAHPDAHAEHLRRRRSTTSRRSRRCSTASIDTLHFDEAWLPHAAFHEFYSDMHAIGKDRPRSQGRR